MSRLVMWRVTSEAGTDWCCIHCGVTALAGLVEQHGIDPLRAALVPAPDGTVCVVQTVACTAWRDREVA